MSTIQYQGSTYRGTAEGDHGVFNNSDGTVIAGKIANCSACVGVCTFHNGTTAFVECDADGKLDGRNLACRANGETVYRLWEHGESKEEAVLRADGTCKYNDKACSADFPPFVKLKAKVLPIKVRSHSPQPPHPAFAPTHPVPHRHPIRPSAMFSLAGAGLDPRRQGAPAAATDLPPWLRDTTHSGCKKKTPLVQPGRCTGRRVHALRIRHYASGMNACVVHPFRSPPCTRSEPPAPPHAPRRRASPSRSAPCTCTLTPSHEQIKDAGSMRPSS
jgi:hypothetical protein